MRAGRTTLWTYRRCATINVSNRGYTVTIAQGNAPWPRSLIVLWVEGLSMRVEGYIRLQPFAIFVVREQSDA